MKKRLFLIVLLVIGMNVSLSYAQEITRQSVLDIAERVFDWQQANPTGMALWEWEYGAYYSGLMDLYKVDPKIKYLTAMIDMGLEYNWSVRPRVYDANMLAISHMYIDLYSILRDERIIDKTVYVLDAHFVRHPVEPDITFAGNRYWWNWWSWCDALFMAPPAFAKYTQVSGEMKYLEKMDELWTLTHNYLYDNEEHLYFRDDNFFDARTPNGKKIFWSRGNGWVLAGLAKVLEAMPADYHNRPFYENLFREMSAKIRDIQRPDGHWTSSLLDPDHFGGMESSGTAFFCYSLAFGINNGLLERSEYEDAVMKAWRALVRNVHEDGMLGYVQSINHGPAHIASTDSEAYGSGAFMMAASEVYKLLD